MGRCTNVKELAPSHATHGWWSPHSSAVLYDFKPCPLQHSIFLPFLIIIVYLLIYFNYGYTFLSLQLIWKFLEARAKILLIFVTSVYTSKVPALEQVLNKKLLNKWEWRSLFCHFICSVYVRSPFFSVIVKFRFTRSDHNIC